MTIRRMRQIAVAILVAVACAIFGLFVFVLSRT